jgi:hypothetical protein
MPFSIKFQNYQSLDLLHESLHSHAGTSDALIVMHCVTDNFWEWEYDRYDHPIDEDPGASKVVSTLSSDREDRDSYRDGNNDPELRTKKRYNSLSNSTTAFVFSSGQEKLFLSYICDKDN